MYIGLSSLTDMNNTLTRIHLCNTLCNIITFTKFHLERYIECYLPGGGKEAALVKAENIQQSMVLTFTSKTYICLYTHL